MKFTKEKSCENKKFFATKSEADMAAMNTGAYGDSIAAAYKCLFCPGWHVGHRHT